MLREMRSASGGSGRNTLFGDHRSIQARVTCSSCHAVRESMGWTRWSGTRDA